MLLMKITVTNHDGQSTIFNLSKAALAHTDSLGLDKIVDALRANAPGWSEITLKIENGFGQPS